MDGANVQFWLQNIDRLIENVNLRDKIRFYFPDFLSLKTFTCLKSRNISQKKVLLR